MIIMKIIVKSLKVSERAFIKIYQRYYKCTIHLFITITILSIITPPTPHTPPPQKNNNNSRTGSQQSCSKVSTCSLEFVKLLPGLDYLIKSRKKNQVGSAIIDGVPG